MTTDAAAISATTRRRALIGSSQCGAARPDALAAWLSLNARAAWLSLNARAAWLSLNARAAWPGLNARAARPGTGPTAHSRTSRAARMPAVGSHPPPGA